MNIGLSKILKQKPYKPVHKYHEMADKQEIFYEALEPLHEMEHQGRSKIIVLLRLYVVLIRSFSFVNIDIFFLVSAEAYLYSFLNQVTWLAKHQNSKM